MPGKKERVSMSRGEFKKEHKELVRILRTGTPAERRKEASSQEKESKEK